MNELEERLIEAGLRSGMTDEEARLAASDAVRRQEWRLRRGFRECSSCREKKPVAEFRRNVSRRDGRHHACRDCESDSRSV